MASPMTSHLTLSDLERSNLKGHSDVESLYLVKELCHMLLLNINRKAYMGSPMTLVTFDLE